MLGVAQKVLRAVGATLPSPSAALISRWTLDEASGATATDAAGHSNGTYSNVALQQDPLVDGDPGTSVRFFGDSAVAVPHVAAYEVESYSVVVYGQVQSVPGPGANAILVQKDRPTLPGGFHIGIVNDGGTLRAQAYTKDASGNAIWVGSAQGVGQVVPAMAFMLVMTCGGSGTRVYLDKAVIGSNNNHVGLIDNDEQVGIGRYRPGIADTGGFNGWIDEVRFYQGVVAQDEIAALPSAQDLVIPPIEEDSYTVPVVPSAPSGTTRFVSSGIGTGAPAAGNDSSGDGSIGNPYRTLAKALSVASSGNTIVLRKGIYRGEANLNANISNLTIKGYDQDIVADPLNSNNWPIIDGGIDMASVTWELVDAGRQEYRTTAADLVGSNFKLGCAIYAGTGTYKIPRWEPLGGYFEPNKLNRLPAYAAQGTTGAWSFAAFRGGAATQIGAHQYYHEPGVALGSDNRVHIRLQPQDSNTRAGQDFDDYNGDYNPSDHSVFLWSQGRTLFTTIAAGLTIEGVFIRCYDNLYDGSGRNNVTIRRNVIWPCHNQDPLITWRSTSQNLLIQHNVWIGGLPDCHIWGSGKHSGYFTHVGGNYGRLTPMVMQDGPHTNTRILDNLFIRVFDVVFGDISNTSSIEIAHNAIDVIDDVCQMNKTINNEHVHHNFCIGPIYGCGGGSVPTDPKKYIHHNVSVLTRWRIHRPGEAMSWFPYTPHSPGGNNPFHWYYNTIIYTNPNKDNDAGVSHLDLLTGNSTGANGPHSFFDNIAVVVNRQAPGAYAGSGHRHILRQWYANEPTRRLDHDGNAWFQNNRDGKGAGPLFLDIRLSNASPSAENFASLAAWLASSKFQASKNLYAPGFEANSIQAHPQFAGGDDAFVNSGRGVPPSYYRALASAYANGSVNLGAGGLNTGWPETGTYQAYRGALDPNGDGTEVGPRAAA